MAYILAAVIAVIPRKSLRVTVRILFYGATLFLFAVSQFLSVNFDTIISPAILAMIAETTTRESSEFLGIYLFNVPSMWVYRRCGLMIVVFLMMEWGYRRLLLTRKWGECDVLGAFVLLALVYSAYSLRVYAPLLSWEQMDLMRAKILEGEESGNLMPQDHITRLFRSIIFLNSAGKEMEHAVKVSEQVLAEDVHMADSANVVLVIGETYIKHHSGLYGYYLNTTPQLSDEARNGNLFVFTDVVTPYNSTSYAMKNILCCNSVGDGERWWNSPFVPVIFEKAGFDVYFWDNQRDFDKLAEFSFNLNSFIYHPRFLRCYKAVNHESYQCDGDLFGDFASRKQRLRPRSNFVIFHLVGQHIQASTRYPHTPKFQRFSLDSVRRSAPYLTDEAKRQIAAYDNATYYNDHVMASIINYFKDQDAVLVYLSDHGDEVYDYRDHLGRDHRSQITDSCAKYQFEIPFMIWCSDRYQQNHPEVMQAIAASVDKPFMSDNLCHVLFYLAGIRSKYYRDNRNVLSDSYVCPPRIIGGRADYDKIMKRKP